MPDTTPDTQAVFIQLVSKSIESNTELKTKVDLISDSQRRLDLKLDGLLTTLTRMETLSGSTLQRMETIERSVSDHEARLRLIEPFKDKANENLGKIQAITLENKEQAEAIAELENKIFKTGLIASFVLIAVQFALSAFVVPWIQTLVVR